MDIADTSLAKPIGEIPGHGAAIAARRVSLIVEEVSVTYRAYAGGARPTVANFVTGGFRQRRRRSIDAVRSVSFRAHEGEAIGIVGRNGSGKSTLMRAIAGLLPVAAGRVLAASDPVLVGVNAALISEVSGRRNVFLGCAALGIEREETRERIEDIVGWAGLERFIDLPLATYSSGMRARLQFAIATMVRPEIMLIDEALAVGDAEFRLKSEVRLKEMLDNAKTVIFVSHSIGAVEALCSRIIWLDAGAVLLDDDAEIVAAAYRAALRAAAAAASGVSGSARAEGPLSGRAVQSAVVSESAAGDGGP